MKRVAFIHEVYPLGGAEKVTSDIVRYLSARGGGNSRPVSLSVSSTKRI